MSHKDKIRAFIMENILSWDQDAELEDDANIFKLGFVNSLFAMQLLGYLEQEFSIHISNSEMKIDNFSSVNNILALVEKKLVVHEA
jgi:methoxymalonate biosynthesis acyl carrier protein